MKSILTALLATLLIVSAGPILSEEAGNPQVIMQTSRGPITLELFVSESPITTANFLALVEANHFDGLIFHRVIKGFMVQGGGFDTEMNQRETGAPIKNESFNGLQNLTGTIAMARTSDPDSATAQFFINTVDNDFLNATEDGRAGYAVFGKVSEGMDVVTAIEDSETGSEAGMNDVPVVKTVIHSVELR